MDLHVTRWDIRSARLGSRSSCVLAQAVRRLYRNSEQYADHVEVNSWHIKWHEFTRGPKFAPGKYSYRSTYDRTRYLRLTKKAIDYAKMFDEGHEVVPTHFRLSEVDYKAMREFEISKFLQNKGE